jgi:hypothetical protein
MQRMARLGSREDRGFTVNPDAMQTQELKLLQRVDAMFLEHMRQIHIGSSLALGVVPITTIDYIATSSSYSTFMTTLN